MSGRTLRHNRDGGSDSRRAHNPGALAGMLAIGTLLNAASGFSAAAGDAEYGEYLSSQCVTCHQASGADKGIPAIVGWDTESFTAVMLSYKTKEREHAVMQTIAASLDREQIEALAAYFAALEPSAE